MPYDPNYPPTNAPLDSAPMRAQFTGIVDLIAAVPTITGAQVDAVNTLPPGTPATVIVSITGSVLHLTFGIPAGESGPPGQVTEGQLTAAINTTPHNPSSVQPLNVNFTDPVSAGDLNMVKDKVNELITTLIRLP
jgi:hypothetical protein